MPDGPALALVPARLGSKGVPGKNLRQIGGVSLTALAVRCARATGLFERIVVSTDGAEIAAEGRSAGAASGYRYRSITAANSGQLPRAANSFLSRLRDTAKAWSSRSMTTPIIRLIFMAALCLVGLLEARRR